MQTMIRPLKNNLEVLQFPGLAGNCNISHFITTRQGGVSTGAYAQMNPGLYTDDCPDSIRKNREILAEGIQLPVQNIITPHQTHQDRIIHINSAFMELTETQQKQQLDGVDALFTSLPQVCVSVSTADCVPILLYAPDTKTVAAIHAGWRGTVLQIAAKTVRQMIKETGCNPELIQAAIGPSISQEAFEVGDEVVEAFRQSGAWTAEETSSLCWNNPKTGKTHIDLWKANELQLQAEGILPHQIENARICTYQHADRFFSARREGIHSGRILSGIFIL